MGTEKEMTLLFFRKITAQYEKFYEEGMGYNEDR